MRGSGVNIEFAVADTELAAPISPLLSTPSPYPGPSSDLPLPLCLFHNQNYVRRRPGSFNVIGIGLRHTIHTVRHFHTSAIRHIGSLQSDSQPSVKGGSGSSTLSRGITVNEQIFTSPGRWRPVRVLRHTCSNRLQAACNPQAIRTEAQTSRWRRKSWFEPAYKRLA